MCGHPSDQSQALNTHGTIRNCPFSNRFLTRKWNYPSCYFTLKHHGIGPDPGKYWIFFRPKNRQSMMFKENVMADDGRVCARIGHKG